MPLRIRQSFKILAPGSSLRRRVAYSLLVVRLILVPVIFLAVYYLFAMGWIVDRIVNVDAPATTLSEQVSVEMLEARRAERNYLLLRNPAYVEANRASIAKTRETLIEIQNLVSSEQPDAQNALDELRLYQQRFEAAVSMLGEPGQAPTDRCGAQKLRRSRISLRNLGLDTIGFPVFPRRRNPLADRNRLESRTPCAESYLFLPFVSFQFS